MLHSSTKSRTMCLPAPKLRARSKNFQEMISYVLELALWALLQVLTMANKEVPIHAEQHRATGNGLEGQDPRYSEDA